MSPIKNAAEFKAIIAEPEKHKQVSRIFTEPFTPKGMGDLRSLLSDQNLPVFDMLIGSNVWNDLVSDVQFVHAIEPVGKHELLITGLLATLYGMNIWSDAYFHPEERFVDRRAVHMFAL